MLVRLKFLTSGESHGKGLLGILDGIPAGLEISEEYIGYQLRRRQMGYGRGGRMKIEKDCLQSINNNSERISIVSQERVTNELFKKIQV